MSVLNYADSITELERMCRNIHRSLVPGGEVYEESLRAAGFSDIEWVPLTVSEAGIREFGEEFWTDLLAHPPLVMLRCRA